MSDIIPPPKLIIITQGYPPLDGGVATSSERIAKHLSLAGVSVLLITFDYTSDLAGPDTIFYERDGAVQVCRVGPFSRQTDLNENQLATLRRRAFDQMENLALRFEPDLVLSLYASNSGLLGQYLANRLMLPHVAGVRGNDVGRNIFSTRWLSFLSSIVVQCDKVVCVNRHLQKRLLTAFPSVSEKSCVIANSVDISAVRRSSNRAYIQSQTDWDTGIPVVVFIGTAREKKGIATLIEAYSKAIQEVPLRLLLVGPLPNANDIQSCRDIWKDLLTRGLIHVTGQQPRDLALQIASEGNYIVMPSLEDGMANGLLEGISVGLCPIVSDLFTDLIVDGTSGWVVRRNSVADLLQALVSAAGERERGSVMWKSANETLQRRHSPEREAREYLQLFSDLIGRSSPTKSM